MRGKNSQNFRSSLYCKVCSKFSIGNIQFFTLPSELGICHGKQTALSQASESGICHGKQTALSQASELGICHGKQTALSQVQYHEQEFLHTIF